MRRTGTTRKRYRRRRLMSRVPRESTIPLHQTARVPMSFTPTRSRNREAVVNTGERKERRGFASMSPEKQREIASKGGRAAHEKGTAHEWSAEEARSAGRKGGQVSRGGRGRLIVPPADASPIAGQPTGDATS